MDPGPRYRFYGDLASWWPLISPHEDYAEEAAFLRDLLPTDATDLLELGSGGGHNAVYLKRGLTLTLVDLSEDMLELSRLLNPECEHLVGDMRTVRLGRTFDAVVVHDAIDYMTTEDDLATAIATVAAHCRTGATAVFVPDHVADTFVPYADHGGTDAPDGRGVRYLEWTADPDPTDGWITTDYAFLFRHADGRVEHAHETHRTGLFARTTWLRLLREAGFDADVVLERTTEPRAPRVLRGTGGGHDVTAEVAAPAELTLASARGRIALAASVGASAMALLDATVVNVALPRIGEDLGVGVADLQWVLTGYLLALASLILVGGALGDRYGRRRVFMIGTAWFAAASLLCGLAPSIEVLIAARVLQGIGGALLTPGSLAIIQASFRERDRGPAVGAWSGLGGIAGAVGPFVGGFLVDGPGWRWAFLVNVPVAAVVILCTVRAIPESRDPDARHLDVIGAAIAVVTLAASTWALTESGPRGWSDPTVIAAAFVAVLGGGAFVLRMLRARDPLVPPALFADRTFTVTNVATFLLYGALGVTFFLVAYQLQVAAGWSAMAAGVALLPVTVLMLVGSAPSGALAQRIGPRIQLTVGPLLAAVGLLLLTRIGPDAEWFPDVFPGAFVFGLGLVTFVAPLTATVMAAADQRHVSVASGVNNAIARAASLTALAVIPAAAGLADATGAAAVSDAVHTALTIAAALAATAGVVSFVGLAPRVRAARSARRVTCAVDGAPIQPDPERCPFTTVEAA